MKMFLYSLLIPALLLSGCSEKSDPAPAPPTTTGTGNMTMKVNGVNVTLSAKFEETTKGGGVNPSIETLVSGRDISKPTAGISLYYSRFIGQPLSAAKLLYASYGDGTTVKTLSTTAATLTGTESSSDPKPVRSGTFSAAGAFTITEGVFTNVAQ